VSRALRVPAVLAAAILVGASLLQAALGPLYGGVVRLEVANLPDSPAPVPRWSAASRWAPALVHETLVVLDADGQPRPRLATGWVAAADHREWTLTLPEGLVFHDGRSLGAADAVRSLRRFLRSGSPAAWRLADALDGGRDFRRERTEALPGLDAPESGRLVLRTVAPDARVVSLLASPAAALTSPQGAGAGPFVPSLWSTHGATLTAFTGHVQGRPLLDEVKITIAGDGGADLRSAAIARTGWTPVSAGASTLFLILDPHQPPFAAPAARATVSRAIDSGLLVQHFLKRGEPTRSLLPRDLSLGSPTGPRPRPPVRLEGALTLEVSTDVPPLVSQRVVAHLVALGLSVQAAPAPPGSALIGPHGTRLALWSPEIAEPGEALAELARLVGARFGSEGRRLMEAANGLTGEARRAQLARAEESLLATHVLIPLAAVPVEIHARPGLHDVRIDAAGVLHLEDAWREP
jgi:ABC-type transport system substrate-binding protein